MAETKQSSGTLTSSCHCGAVQLTFPTPTEALNECQCTVCRKYGALWAYYEAEEVKIEGKTTEKYSWRRKIIDFHRCPDCGCMMFWAPSLENPRKDGGIGVNCRMLDREIVDKLERTQEDGPD